MRDDRQEDERRTSDGGEEENHLGNKSRNRDCYFYRALHCSYCYHHSFFPQEERMGVRLPRRQVEPNHELQT